MSLSVPTKKGRRASPQIRHAHKVRKTDTEETQQA